MNAELGITSLRTVKDVDTGRMKVAIWDYLFICVNSLTVTLPYLSSNFRILLSRRLFERPSEN